ncbi:hypothetical protein O181_050590 [Austropuccinia psidii MF-1]|uniref:Uncharacterized protein n=1 Tax=Austropuccinia psidii MF-1 TaxID=1389203 RepID=A0A9Q3E1C5_9BASI|nr:hypothetical protein [Austropuccinia psidii MF-1]
MICLVLDLNIDLKMSSKLTSICEFNYSYYLPSVLYGAGVFDSLRELSEESMAPTEIYDIKKTYDGFKSVRVIEPPCINCQKKGVPCVESATARSTRCQLCNIGKRNFSQASHRFPDNPRRLWSSIKRVEDFDWKLLLINLQPLMPPLATPIDGRLGKLKRNLVVQDEIDTDSEGSDEIYREELDITTPIQKIKIQSTSLSPVPASTTIHEVIRSPQPPQPPIRSPTRPSTLASTSTNTQPPMARTSRDPMSSEPESIFDHCQHCNITGNFTDQKKVNKKVVTSLFSEVDALTEVFGDKAIKSAVPGEPTRDLAREAVYYEDALVFKLREALKKF